MAKKREKAPKNEAKVVLPSLASLYAHLKIPEDYLGPGEMAGSLDHLSLPELLQILEANKKTGVLLLKAGEKKGHIIFSRGQILDAVCDQKEGEGAIYTLIPENKGLFRFLPMEVPQKDKIKKHASDLILEAPKTNEGE